MAAKGGVWTKKGFVKAANRKDNGGVTVAVAEDNDPATQLNSSVSTDTDEKQKISDEAYRLREEAERQLEDAWDKEGDRDFDEKSTELLEDNVDILDDTRRFLNRNKNPNTVGVIVKDKNGNTQAVSAVRLKPDSVYVEFLATNPDNILKDNPKRVSGSGTQALARVAKLAQEKGQPVKLFSLPNAKPFYEKLGFKPNSPGSYEYTLKGSDLDKLAERAR